MNILISVLASIIPVLIILAVIYNMSEVKKQPLWLLFILFLGGILSWVMVRYISRFLGNDIYKSQIEINEALGNKGFFLVSFGIIAIIEEMSKYIVITIMCFKNKYFKNPYDAIMYAVCISLGFAFVENIMYINNYGMGVAISRAIFSIPAHASFGIIMGYYLGVSKLCRDKGEANASALTRYSAFFIPLIFHGFYDFLLNFNTESIYIIFLIYVIIMYAFVILLLFRLNRVDDKWLRHQKNDSIPVYEVKKKAHKNMYYDVLYNDDTNASNKNIDTNNTNQSVKTNWRQAESNDTFYENDKVEMNMFREESNNK